MKPFVCFTGLLLCLQGLLLAQEPLTIGQIHTLQSAILEEKRTLNIQLPLDYDPAKAYPILYLLDGSLHEDFLHICGLEQFFNLQYAVTEFIIVGIANVDRQRDFTLHTNSEELRQEFPTWGHSEPFIRFIEEELQPYVEEHFSGNGERYIIGQSLGGLLATEILLKKPTLFTHYLIVSPSLWWDDQSLLDIGPDLLASHTDLPEHIYVSVGKKEHPIMRRDAKSLYRLLKSDDRLEGKLYFNLMKKEDHASILHNSIYEAFHFLFVTEED